MDWFLYDRDLCHEKVDQVFNNSKQDMSCLLLSVRNISSLPRDRMRVKFVWIEVLLNALNTTMYFPISSNDSLFCLFQEVLKDTY